MNRVSKTLIAAAAAAAMIAVPMSASAATVDSTKPVVSLTSGPTSAFNSTGASLVIAATDNVGLKKIVANIYSGATLVDPSQVAASGTSGSLTVDLTGLPTGTYTVKYNALDTSDLVAQTQTLTLTVDNNAPVITLKAGSTFVNGWTTIASFGLADNAGGLIDYVTVNGVKKDLSNNRWSDLNAVKPGQFGAVQGLNTIIAYDTAGNASAPYLLYLDTTGPTATLKTGTSSVDGTVGGGGAYRFASYKLNDQANVARLWVNGIEKEVSDNVWSDLNGLRPGVLGAVEGLNTLVFADGLGNQSTYTVILDTTPAVVTGITQVWDEVGQRTWVTLTFDSPVYNVTQGFLPDGNAATQKKAYYNTKLSTVNFTDAAGNPGVYQFTPIGAPVAVDQ